MKILLLLAQQMEHIWAAFVSKMKLGSVPLTKQGSIKEKGKGRTHFSLFLKSLPAGIPWYGPVYSQHLSLYLSQKSSEEEQEFLAGLQELMEFSKEQLDTFRKEFYSKDGITKEQVAQTAGLVEEILNKNKENIKLNSAFLTFESKFELVIRDNFLEKFDGSDNPDYSQLLSDDFKNLFFSFFNKKNVICIHGRRGTGKTFSCLLLAKKLQQEGYSVYYNSIKRSSLSEKIFPELGNLINRKFVFIIDGCEDDFDKTEAVLERLGNIKNIESPNVIFLVRNDGGGNEHIAAMLEGFVERYRIPLIEFKEKFVDLEFLSKLFFRKINQEEKIEEFLSAVKSSDLSKILFESKNMEFWNMFFKQLQKQIEKGKKIRTDESEFYNGIYEYFLEKEHYLIDCKDFLIKLLPFFKNGLAVRRDYMQNAIDVHHEQYQRLLDLKIISLHSRNWGSDYDTFIESNFHSTKAEIIEKVLMKREHVSEDGQAELTNYMICHPNNLYDIITPFYSHASTVLNEFCTDESLVLVLKKYLKETRLGKKLDKVIKTLSIVNPQLKDILIDEEIIDSLGEKLNRKDCYLISRVYLFRAMNKFSRTKSVQLYKRFNHRIVIDDFCEDPKGVYSFVKLMEPLKDVFLDCADRNEQTQIRNSVKEILDGCRENFLKKFEKHHYFTQFHLFLKRLDRMHLGSYFLTGIPAEKILEWIRTKNTNSVELRFLFFAAQETSIKVENTTVSLYEYFKNAIVYEDIKRIFDNSRSDLNDIALASMYNPQILGNHFYQYSQEEDFIVKIKREDNLYRANQVLIAIERVSTLSGEQKRTIITTVINNLNQEILWKTKFLSTKLDKNANLLEQEKQLFLDYKKRYCTPSN